MFNIDNPLRTLTHSMDRNTKNDDTQEDRKLPLATETCPGVIQLSGALSGTATFPKLTDGSVGSSQLVPGSVSEDHIMKETITSLSLAHGCITSKHLVKNSVGPSHITKGAIETSHILDESIGSTKIANGAIHTSKLCPLSGPSALIGSNSISPNATNIILDQSLQINSNILSVNTDSLTETLTGTLTGTLTETLTGTLTENLIKTLTETIIDVVPQATTTSLGSIQLTGALGGSATFPTISNGAVGSLHIAPNTIARKHLTSNSVGGSQIIDGSIESKHITSNCIGLEQLSSLSGPSELIGSGNASSKATNISLGNGLSINDGVLSVNKTVPPATALNLGTVQLSGALSGSAQFPTLASDCVGRYQIMDKCIGPSQLGNNVIGLDQLSPLDGVSMLIGSNNASSDATNITIGNGLVISDDGVLSSLSGGVPISVKNGGTGVTSIKPGNILIGNGTGPITSVSTIQVSSITPNVVGSVNGITPMSAGGNVDVLISNVMTGALSEQPEPQPSGYIYVVSDDPTPSNNGLTFISTGNTWQPVTGNLATTDARYVQLSGSGMNTNSNLVFPSTGHITLNQTSFESTDAVTAEYVSSQILAGTPGATPTSLGMIRLSGALSGSALSPFLSPGAVHHVNMAVNSVGASQIIIDSIDSTHLGNNIVGTEQLAMLSSPSQLLGSGSESMLPTNISLGNGLVMNGNMISVDPVAIPFATPSSFGTIQLTGALSGNASSPRLAANSVGSLQIGSQAVGSGQIANGAVGATQIAANSIGTDQLAPLSSPSELIGSTNASNSASNIVLGPGLSMSDDGVLSVTPLPSVPSSSTSLGTIQLTGGLSGTATHPVISNNAVGTSQLANNAVTSAQIANGAVGLPQLAPLSGSSRLIGSASGSNSAVNITLGAGLSMSAGGQLIIDSSAASSRNSTQSPTITGIITPTTSLSPDNDLQLSINTSGQLLANYSSGIKTVYVIGSETNDGLPPSLPTFGQKQLFDTTPIIVASNGIKKQIGLGSMINFYNATDNLFYNINYFITEIVSPVSAIIQIRT